MERKIVYKIKKSLIAAIDENNLNEIQTILSNYKKRKRLTTLNDTTRMHENPIHYAARHGKLEVLKLLIKSNIFQIDEKNTNGETPMCVACDIGFVEIAQELIRNGAKVNCENDKYKTPLILATELLSPYDMEMTRLLVENGACVNKKTHNNNTALLSAAKYGNLELVKYLVDNHQAKINHKFHDGATPLMRACYYGYTDLVKYLVDSGALVEDKNNRLETPLYIASFRGHLEIVKILLQLGANVNSEDYDGDTPLTVACYENRASIIPLLLENNAKVNQKGIRGDTALHITCSNCSISEVRGLLSRGAFVNVLNHDGETPLHIAARQSRVDIINEVLDRTLLINARSKNGLTAFRSLIEHLSIPKIDVALKMIRLGCDVNINSNRTCVAPQMRLNLTYTSMRFTCLEQILNFFDNNLLKNEQDKQKLIHLIDTLLKVGYEPDRIKDAYKLTTTNLLNNYPLIRKYFLARIKSCNSLANLCRLKIRNLLPKPLAISIKLLNLPNFIKDYIFLNK